MRGLSEKTWELVQRLFPTGEQVDVGEFLVSECGNKLPFCEHYDAYQLERIRFAVLKLSGGNAGKLLDAIALAQTDWRDLLMEAGFGYSITAHIEWADTVE